MRKLVFTTTYSFFSLLVSLAILSCNLTVKAQEHGHTEGTTSGVSKKSIDIQKIESILGMKGKDNNGEYKVTVPQNDLNVEVDGFKIIPPMGLGSWAAFAPASDGVMVMGDIVVTEDDLKPVQQEVIRQGLHITAIHNHFVRNEPDVMYMHIGGTSSEEKLANAVKAVFSKVEEIRGGDPSEPSSESVQNTLDTANGA